MDHPTGQKVGGVYSPISLGFTPVPISPQQFMKDRDVGNVLGADPPQCSRSRPVVGNIENQIQNVFDYRYSYEYNVFF